ncbi:LEPR-XLL domain-containing protein [Xenorhabdus koppenhoeferi]
MRFGGVSQGSSTLEPRILLSASIFVPYSYL